MSRTALLEGPSTHSVVFSPSKKRLLDQETGQDNTRLNELNPTRTQLWRWCLRADAIAQCYIRDVMQLKENSNENRQGMCILSNAVSELSDIKCNRFRCHLVARLCALSQRHICGNVSRCQGLREAHDIYK